MSAFTLCYLSSSGKIGLIQKPVWQSCAVAKSDKFWRATGQSNLADRMEDCPIGQSAAMWVRKQNFLRFCCGQPLVCQVWLSNGPPEFVTFSYSLPVSLLLCLFLSLSVCLSVCLSGKNWAYRSFHVFLLSLPPSLPPPLPPFLASHQDFINTGISLLWIRSYSYTTLLWGLQSLFKLLLWISRQLAQSVRHVV